MPKKSQSSKSVTSAQKPMKTRDGYPTIHKALSDFQRAYDYKRDFLIEAEQDHRTYLGEQWESEDVAKMEEIGVKPLVLNKIAPAIRLIKGIEAQNRTDPKAYPEGKEDSVEAEIATGLLRNVYKNSEINFEITDIFEDGNVCGEGSIEPFLDFTDNMILGKLATKKIDYWNSFPDPEAKKYDHSDGAFYCKVTYDLTKDELLMLFPEKSGVIEDIESGKFNFTGLATEALNPDTQRHGYNADDDAFGGEPRDESLFDLLEYYYKRYIETYYVGDMKMGAIKQAKDKAEAEAYVATANAQTPGSAKLIKRYVPEIWVMSVIGGMEEPLDDARAWFYPRWKTWPVFTYYCYRSTAKIRSASRKYKVQGIVRTMKDIQFEHNKRRIQELRHINQTANSGWIAEDGSWVDEDKVEKFGSTPGINLYYKNGAQKPERIFPAPLSQGHAQLAQEMSADMKEASMINTDLLALEQGGSDSGRAIALRQKQGMTMVQGIFDNLSRTKKNLNKFILSQLSEIYTIETAQRVMGEAFMSENFMMPQLGPNGVPIVDPMTGQPVMVPDQQRANDVFQRVLLDTEAGTYDVAISEIVSSESMQYATYMTLTDLASKGIPIPPEVLIDESLIPEASKKKIQSAIQQAQLAAANNPKKGATNAKS